MQKKLIQSFDRNKKMVILKGESCETFWQLEAQQHCLLSFCCWDHIIWTDEGFLQTFFLLDDSLSMLCAIKKSSSDPIIVDVNYSQLLQLMFHFMTPNQTFCLLWLEQGFTSKAKSFPLREFIKSFFSPIEQRARWAPDNC